MDKIKSTILNHNPTTVEETKGTFINKLFEEARRNKWKKNIYKSDETRPRSTAQFNLFGNGNTGGREKIRCAKNKSQR